MAARPHLVAFIGALCSKRHSLIILLFKSAISLLLKTRITSLFSSATLKVIVGSLILASQLYYSLGQLKIFLIMLSLGSIDSIFFLQSISNACRTISR